MKRGSTNRTEVAIRRILIVDDHPIVRQGLVALIAQQTGLEVLGEAANVAAALRHAKATRPDLIIVDIQLNGENGIELIRKLKALQPHIKILVSSIHDEMVFAERALRAGALGYICKRDSVSKILDAVHQVLRGKIYLSPHMANHLLHRVTEGRNLDQNFVQGLTNRELEVFELIGQGNTRQQIASKLFISPRTVETHRQNIKQKLNLQNSAQLIRSAIQWVLEGY